MNNQDDLLVRFSLNWAEAIEGTVKSIDGGVLRRPEFFASDVGRAAGLQNSVVLLRPFDAAAIGSLMTELDNFFAFDSATQAGTVYLFSAWPVADLAGYGWEYVEQMPLMLRPPTSAAPSLPSSLQIVNAHSVAELNDFEHVMIAGFPLPELCGLPPGSAFGPDLLQDSRFHFWFGWDNGQPVTGSAIYIAHGLVNLIFLATVPQARDRGFGSAMAWAATLADPQLPAMLIASHDGYSLYTKIGYQHLCDMPLWKRDRP